MWVSLCEQGFEMPRRSPLDLVEGFYTSQAVWALHRLGALRSLEDTTDISDLAEQLNCDEHLFSALIDYVYHTTDLLIREGTRYHLSPTHRANSDLGFHIDKFLGAYGPAIADVIDVLADPTKGPTLRDGAALARAFIQLAPQSPSLTGQLLQAWRIPSLLDLGCGTGNLLIELAQSDLEFHGWGVDSSSDMVTTATEHIRHAGLSARIQIAHGDVRALNRSAVLQSREAIRALYARSVINEFFADRGRSAVDILLNLKRLFPGRRLFIEDYYGRLTHNRPVNPAHQHTLLQDLAQAVSGQGIPPPDLPGWAQVYEAAGCDFVKAYEGDNNGVAWFIHVLHL